MRNFEFRVQSKIVRFRLEASKFLAFIHLGSLKPIIRISWKIKPSLVKVIAPPSVGSVVLFAHSTGRNQKSNLRSFRVLNRTPGFEPVQVTTYEFTDSSFNRKLGVIEGAEDARVFGLKGNQYLYYQTLDEDSTNGLDCDIWIFDPINQKSRKVIAGLSYNGKNWAPFELNDELYFIYSFDPFIVLKANLDGNQEIICEQIWPKVKVELTNLKWGDSLGYFGPIRGGSQLVPINDHYFIGFTHITLPTPLKFSHQIGVVILDTRSFEYHHKILTDLRYGLLVDPYGIEINANTISVSYSYSINRPEDTFSAVGSSTAYFQKERIFSIFQLPDLN